jgi:hypothetical protein
MERTLPTPSKRARALMNKKSGRMAHRSMVAGRGILRKHGDITIRQPQVTERTVLAVKRGPISLLIANSRSTFDSAVNSYGGEAANLALPATRRTANLVYPGPDLVLVRLTFKGIFSGCFIPSTIDTSKRQKAPVGLCVCHKRLLAPGGHGATAS